MTNFIYDNTNLAFPKLDLQALPVGADPTKYVQASEWNAVCQASKDMQGVLRGAKWFGFTPQGSDPVPAGVTNYLWLTTGGILTLTFGASTLQLVNATRNIIAGTGLSGGGTLSADRTISLQILGSSPAGSYTTPTMTVDQFGRVTAISSGVNGYITAVNNVAVLTQRGTFQVDGTNLVASDDAGNAWTAIRLGANITVTSITTGIDNVKTHAAFTGSAAVTETGAIQTLDATPIAAMTIALADTTDYSIAISVTARDVAGTERAMYGKKALVYREGGGATLQGSVQSLHTDVETSAGLDATIVVSGNNAVVQVTGKAATTINWVITVNLQAVSGNT